MSAGGGHVHTRAAHGMLGSPHAGAHIPRSLKAFITCGECRNRFTVDGERAPKQLTCGHVYCTSCAAWMTAIDNATCVTCEAFVGKETRASVDHVDAVRSYEAMKAAKRTPLRVVHVMLGKGVVATYVTTAPMKNLKRSDNVSIVSEKGKQDDSYSWQFSRSTFGRLHCHVQRTAHTTAPSCCVIPLNSGVFTLSQPRRQDRTTVASKLEMLSCADS